MDIPCCKNRPVPPLKHQLREHISRGRLSTVLRASCAYVVSWNVKINYQLLQIVKPNPGNAQNKARKIRIVPDRAQAWSIPGVTRSFEILLVRFRCEVLSFNLTLVFPPSRSGTCVSSYSNVVRCSVVGH